MREDQAQIMDVITEVIRPAAIVPEEAARAILSGMSGASVYAEGHWLAEPSRWVRYDQPWEGPGLPGDAVRLGTLQVAYGTPTKYEITVYQVTITLAGQEAGYSVQSLCDEALGYGDLTLAQCPRAALAAPPKPFKF